jgi:hypothetical protein
MPSDDNNVTLSWRTDGALVIKYRDKVIALTPEQAIKMAEVIRIRFGILGELTPR